MAELYALHLDFSLFQISELARKPSWIQPAYFQAAPRDGTHMRIPGVIVAFLTPTSHPERNLLNQRIPEPRFLEKLET